MSLPKQIDSCAQRLAEVDQKIANNFSTSMYEANHLAFRAAQLRRIAWDLYHDTLQKTGRVNHRKAKKGGAE